MPDTETTVTVGIAYAAANPRQQGPWRERRSFLVGFVTEYEFERPNSGNRMPAVY